VAPAVGDVIDVTFATSYPGPSFPAVVITAQDDASAKLNAYVNPSLVGFSIQVANSPSASVPYTWSYIVMGP
jgi:hypothetical protein